MTTAATEVESYLIHEAIMLPLLVKVVENNLAKLKEGTLGRPLQEFYVAITIVMLNAINADIDEVRKSLKSLNIRVWEDSSKDAPDNATIYRYSCRGFEHEIILTRNEAKSKLSDMLAKYSKHVEDQAQSAKK